MAKITFADLVKEGFEVTVEEAQKLHSAITHIAQRGAQGLNDVFNYDPPKDKAASANKVQQSTGFDPNAAKPESAKDKAARLKKEKADADAETIRLADLKAKGLEEREVTQDDLDADTTLAEGGVKVGDVHQFPIAAE